MSVTRYARRQHTSEFTVAGETKLDHGALASGYGVNDSTVYWKEKNPWATTGTCRVTSDSASTHSFITGTGISKERSRVSFQNAVAQFRGAKSNAEIKLHCPP